MIRNFRTIYRLSSSIFAQCTSKEPVKCISGHRTFSKSVADAEEPIPNRDFDFEQRLNDLQPDPEFVASLSESDRSKIDAIRDELQIYVYMGSFVPSSISINDWKKLLKCENVKFRVSCLEHLALKEQRQRKDLERKTKRMDDYKIFLDEQEAKFVKGEMGYGPGMYQLVHNPSRNKKKLNQLQGSKLWRSMRMDQPQVALDLQNLTSESNREQQVLARQIQYVVSENYEATTPLPLTFVNAPKSDFGKEWIQKGVGFYSGSYTDQTILPDISFKGIKETFGRQKEIVYISRTSRDFLDGPLSADVYAVAVTMDKGRQSLGNARRGKFRSVRLPIQRYIKWQHGPMFIPFPNLFRIFREVNANGGDWQSALLNNISKRHLLSEEEREKTIWAASKRKERKRETFEIIQAIQDSTGHS